MNMLNVYLLRHGETPWNVDNNRYCGTTDIGLTEKGLAQAYEVKDRMKDIPVTAVYSSPLQRAHITANIIANREAVADGRLHEVNFGSWEGKTREEFDEHDRRAWEVWIHDPTHSRAGGSGETGQEVVERMTGFFEGLRQQHAEGNVLIVAHNGANRLFACNKLEMPLRNYQRLWWENASITLFTLDERGIIQFRKMNA